MENSSRQQSFLRGAEEIFDVLMDGGKSFRWSFFDILIVSHPGQCIELVAYNAEIGVEAPRIYICSVLLAAKIKPDTFKENISSKKEVLKRQNKKYNTADLIKQAFNELMVNYIMQRLILVDSMEVRVALSPIPEDVCDACDVVICDMPANFHPVKVTYTKMASGAEVLRAQHVLNAERERLVRAHLTNRVFAVSDSSQLMIEARHKLERAMSFPLPRLRWIKAIDTVLVHKYIGRVKMRLLRSNCAAWYQVCASTEKQRAKAQVRAVSLNENDLAHLPAVKGRDRIARFTLDNSDLLKQMHEDSGSPRLSPPKTELPALNPPILLGPMERRRQTKAERESSLGKLGTTLKASSFNGTTKSRLLRGESEMKDAMRKKSLTDKDQATLLEPLLESTTLSQVPEIMSQVPQAQSVLTAPEVSYECYSSKSSQAMLKRDRVCGHA